MTCYPRAWNVRQPAATLAIVVIVCAIASAWTQQPGAPAQARTAAPRTPWADWVEPDFPFFSSVLDARRAGSGLPGGLSPRTLVLNAGRGLWVGFDTDLIRVAAIWRGTGVTPKALAPGSYHSPDRKTPGGQSPAPEPDGKVLLVNGIYPGWQSGARPSLEDPREPAPTAAEVGRGPLPEEMGRFNAVRLVGGGAVLEYTAGGTNVREWMTVSDGGGGQVLERHFDVAASSKPLWLVLGFVANGSAVAVSGEGIDPIVETFPSGVHGSGVGDNGAGQPNGVSAVHVPAHDERVRLCVTMTDSGVPPAVRPRPIPDAPPVQRWPQEVITKVTASSGTAPYVVDDIALPVDNPWHRGIRIGDVQFMADGTGVGVTLDGDVWFIRGMHEPGGSVRWRRFASGLHEPLTLAIRDEQVYVFDRNGIWRLRDTNGDGEADVHELFSNAFAQTADMREFPSTLRLAPGGEFIIAKGGQEATTIGKHNGSVLRVAADGRSATVLGYGFRQPNIGVNPRTGLVTASDQQGNYIPSTPLHVVKDRQFYGFLSDKLPREVYPAPIAEPIAWIPHEVNASAVSQVWLYGARMGPLNDGLVYIGFNRPEIFRVLLDDRSAKTQAAVVSVTHAFDFPPLNGSVNPIDGQLYVAGFQILGWGTTATRLAGLGRVRYTGALSTLPREVVSMDKGMLLRFDVPLDPVRAVDPDNYALSTWHYQRTYKYGSPQLKADGTPGVDRLVASRAYLSKDRKSVFVAVPGMRPVMQMRIGWALATAAGGRFEDDAYLTPYDLHPFDPGAEGFGSIAVDLTPRAAAVKRAAPASAQEGRRLYQAYGCSACHSIEAAGVPAPGPTWKGLYGMKRAFANRPAPLVADAAYLRESMVSPAAKIVSGYERAEPAMPSYAGVLTDAQIESLVLFIKSLQ